MSVGFVTVPGVVRHHLNSQIHLEPGNAHLLFALFHSLRVDLRIIGLRRVGVDANLVAKLAASHHGIHRGVVNLARDVPQRHFYCRYAATLPRVTAKLLDLAKNLVELQWVLSHNATFQKERVGGTCAVAHFAQPVNPLIRVDPNERARTRSRLHHRGHAQIRDPQRRWTGVRVHTFGVSLEWFLREQRASQSQRRSLQDLAAFEYVSTFFTHGS